VDSPGIMVATRTNQTNSDKACTLEIGQPAGWPIFLVLDGQNFWRSALYRPVRGCNPACRGRQRISGEGVLMRESRAISLGVHSHGKL
jgi:hypothetical protein